MFQQRKSNVVSVQQISTPTFVFDLHGVLFHLDKVRVIQEFLKAPRKLNIFLACLNPYFLYTALRLWIKLEVLEQFILEMMERFPIIRPNQEAALKVANAQQTIPEMVDLLFAIRKAGYPIYVFSNIGEQSIIQLQEQYPHIFKCFDGVYSSGAQDNYRAKPHPLAFKSFIETFSIQPDTVIMIDDKSTNLQAAESHRFTTFLYKNNTPKLKALLNSLGVFIDS